MIGDITNMEIGERLAKLEGKYTAETKNILKSIDDLKNNDIHHLRAQVIDIAKEVKAIKEVVIRRAPIFANLEKVFEWVLRFATLGVLGLILKQRL